MRIAPAAYLEAANWDVPIGSGPYVLDTGKTTTGSVYAFTKNEDHWNADHYPYPKLELRVIESDTAAVSALRRVRSTPRWSRRRRGRGGGSDLEVIKFQGQTPRLIISDRTGEVVPALGDVRVRQAMNMVFDKEAMAQQLYLGNAEPDRPGVPRGH